MGFVGRKDEQKRLLRVFRDDAQNATLVYGRRRVGKSELLLHCLRQIDVRTIYYECRQTSEALNVKGLADVVAESFDIPRPAFDGIEEALGFIFERATREKIVLVIDEYPYLRDAVKGMDSILQVLIDTYRNRSHISLVVCGSYVEVMRSLLERENPLYGRIDLKINLKPMDYLDSSEFYPDFSCEDKVRLYSVFGGIPYYNRLIDQDATVRENLIELLVRPDARLEDEVSAFLLSEISKIANANEVFCALADGSSRYKDILDQSHVSSPSMLANVLDKLVKMQLVQKRAPINDMQNKKKSSYVISDGLSLFYYRYVFRYASQRNVLDSDVFFDRFVVSDFENRYVPHAFEEVCRQYLVRQNRIGRIEPPFNLIGRYWYDDPAHKTNGEFDVVTEDPQGYVFYEVKFRSTPVTQTMIDEEISQVRATGLNCHHYGFFSRSGFDGVAASDEIELISLEDMYV